MPTWQHETYAALASHELLNEELAEINDGGRKKMYVVCLLTQTKTNRIGL
jgi:hypothetical protein